MKKLIRRLLFGDVVISEYSTVTVNEEINEKVYLQVGKIIIDVSQCQFLLCLEPVVFGVWIENDSCYEKNNAGYKMYFKILDTKKSSKQKILAIVDLVFFDKIENGNKILLLLKLRNTKIYHTNFIKTHLLYNRFYKKPGFSFNKLKSFVAAYSYPRRVRIISFKQDGYFNIFPMDLLGDIDENNHYVFGLRHTNITLSKIIETKKIVVSEVSYKYKDVIYQLGKHHGSSPPTLDTLPFKTLQSEKFGFPVPDWIYSYKEIKILKTIDLGSHRLLWGEVVNEKKFKEPTGNLYHIHFLQLLKQKSIGNSYTLV